jgi:hypothetical protein
VALPREELEIPPLRDILTTRREYAKGKVPKVIQEKKDLGIKAEERIRERKSLHIHINP